MKATQLGEPILWGFRGVLTPIQKHTGMGTGTGAVFRGSSHAGCCRFGAVHPYTHHGDPHPPGIATPGAPSTQLGATTVTVPQPGATTAPCPRGGRRGVPVPGAPRGRPPPVTPVWGAWG